MCHSGTIITHWDFSVNVGYTYAMQAFIDRQHKTIFIILGAVLAGTAFYSGFLQGKHSTAIAPVILSCKDNVLDKLSIPLEKISNGVVAQAADKPATTQGKLMGSKNGTKYYVPTCSAAKRIKPENYIWFQSAEDAQLQGYTPGKC
jgi:hypothetical protein